MTATCVKIKDAQPMGIYKQTSVDRAKSDADFRVVAVGAKNSIVWKDGRFDMVTDSKLEKLKTAYSWMTDF